MLTTFSVKYSYYMYNKLENAAYPCQRLALLQVSLLSGRPLEQPCTAFWAPLSLQDAASRNGRAGGREELEQT